jgi:L-iditol 2-dehydrogenase
MKVAGLFGIGDIRVTDMEVPSVGDGEILIAVKAATTCGTDLKAYLRGRPGDRYPILPWGHECAGDVVEVGKGVTKFKKGDRIVAHNSVPCYQCFYCKNEQYEFCENLLLKRGAYAEYNKIPAPIVNISTFKIPEHMTYAEASLIEPASCTMHGAARANIRPGDIVAINGAGFQGLVFVQLAKLYGAAKIISLDLSDARLKMARAFGATHTINAAKEDGIKKILQLTGGRGVDIGIEAAGKIQTWENTINMVRKGGKAVIYAGAKPGTSINVSTERIHYQGVIIEGVFHTTPKYVQMMWDLMTNGLINMSPLITRTMKLDDIKKAYEILSGMENNEIKMEIVPE